MNGIPNYLPGDSKSERRSVVMNSIEARGRVETLQRLRWHRGSWGPRSVQRRHIEADIEWVKVNAW